MNSAHSPLWLRLVAAGTIGLTVVVFVIDFLSPLGLAFWVLHLFPLWVASRLYRDFPRLLPTVSFLAIALIAAGLFFATEGVPFWMGLGNRVLWIAVIWTVTQLLLRAARREQGIEEREERLSLALDGAQLGTWEVSLRTGRIGLSARMREMAGLPPEGPPRTLAEWRERIHPDDVERVQREFAAALQALDVFEAQFRLVRPDGGLRWIFSKGKIVRDGSGMPVRYVGIAMDITERRLAEEERLKLLKDAERREQELREKQAQLVQSAKLASLGELTTGIAHEVNNPLNNISLILGNLIDHLELRPMEQEPLLFRLKLALAQVSKAATIIQHLRTFGRLAPVEREPVSVHDVLQSALGLMQEQLRLRNIELTMTLSPAEPLVLGNRIQLEQVFINLLTNARDAVAEAPRKAIMLSSLVREDRVELVFRDTGVGIPLEIQGRIFDPFFTTKPVGQGTGLGLSVSYGIVKEHGGQITVMSGAGEGTTFVIQLPLASPPAEELAELDLFSQVHR
ncbi:sensor histidine kinase [Candidatus Nitrospira bockiana]